MRAVTIAIALGFFALRAGAADVEIRKFAQISFSLAPGPSEPVPTVLRPGVQRLTYDLQVINHGPGTATGIHIVDSLSPRLNFGDLFPSAQPLCSAPPCGGQGTVICDIPSLAPGQSRFLSFTVALRDDALSFEPLLNTATVITLTPDENPANNTSIVSVPVEANVPLAPEALIALAVAMAAVASWKLRS